MAKLNTPMPPTIAQGRTIIQEIIHFYPEMKVKIQDMFMEYINKVEAENNGLYDIES